MTSVIKWPLHAIEIEPDIPPINHRPTRIYFAPYKFEKCFKIGFSVDPGKRLSTLANNVRGGEPAMFHMSKVLTIEFSSRAEARWVEKKLHAKYGRNRYRLKRGHKGGPTICGAGSTEFYPNGMFDEILAYASVLTKQNATLYYDTGWAKALEESVVEDRRKELEAWILHNQNRLLFMKQRDRFKRRWYAHGLEFSREQDLRFMFYQERIGEAGKEAQEYFMANPEPEWVQPNSETFKSELEIMGDQNWERCNNPEFVEPERDEARSDNLCARWNGRYKHL